MSLQGVLPFVFDFLPAKSIEVEVSEARLSGDAGLLPVRQFDEAIQLTSRFAAALVNLRCETGVTHTKLSMVRQRIYGILTGYEDRRASSTNCPGWSVHPQAVYDEYAARGESENRNKKLKRELAADRTSDHRFLANFFRLSLRAAALNLLVRLRRATSRRLQPKDVGIETELPAESLAAPERPTFFHRRRRDDPWAKASPAPGERG